MESSPKSKRTTRVPELDATLSGWSGAEDGSFLATPVSPEMMQLGRQLASTVEERAVRQIQTSLLFVCYWSSRDGVLRYGDVYFGCFICLMGLCVL